MSLERTDVSLFMILKFEDQMKHFSQCLFYLCEFARVLETNNTLLLTELVRVAYLMQNQLLFDTKTKPHYVYVPLCIKFIIT